MKKRAGINLAQLYKSMVLCFGVIFIFVLSFDTIWMREGREGFKSSTLIRTYNVKEHYKILEKVGRGTYGTVFKARGLKDNKFYAIKKL